MPTVEFIALTEEYGSVYDSPIPASKIIPSWWKNKENYMDGEKKLMEGATYNKTSKGCVGLLDAMRSGYIFTAPCDIILEKLDEAYGVSWKSNLFNHINFFHPKQGENSGVDLSLFENEYFKFNTDWLVKTPKGYSCLIQHPMWHDELPFCTLPGIVDTDKFANGMNFPFVVKKGFSGVISMGTPIAQIIPFKRENWEHKTILDADKKYFYNSKKSFKVIENSYNRFVHSTKSWK